VKRVRFLIIAVLLTILDLAVVICCDGPVWASSGDVWTRGISALLAALGATSLANVWALVATDQIVLDGVKSACRGQTAAPDPAQARGQADV
jgi:hypothetical protein